MRSVQIGAALAFAAAVFAGSGFLSFLLGIAEYSVPYFFSEELSWTQGSSLYASIFFHGPTFSYFGCLLVVLSTLGALVSVLTASRNGRRFAACHLAK